MKAKTLTSSFLVTVFLGAVVLSQSALAFKDDGGLECGVLSGVNCGFPTSASDINTNEVTKARKSKDGGKGYLAGCGMAAGAGLTVCGELLTKKGRDKAGGGKTGGETTDGKPTDGGPTDGEPTDGEPTGGATGDVPAGTPNTDAPVNEPAPKSPEGASPTASSDGSDSAARPKVTNKRRAKKNIKLKARKQKRQK